MVGEAIGYRGIFAVFHRFPGFADGAPVPVARSLDAKVVVALCGEIACASCAFEYSLSQCDGSRNAITFAVANGSIGKRSHIVPALCCSVAPDGSVAAVAIGFAVGLLIAVVTVGLRGVRNLPI